MKNWKRSAATSAWLGVMYLTLAISAAQAQTPTISAESSTNWDTRVSSPHVSKGSTRPTTAAEPQEVVAATEKQSFSANRAAKPQRAVIDANDDPSFSKPKKDLLAACNAAVDELIASRKLIEVLESENALLKERLETEKKTVELLAELNETRKAETDALRNTIAAKNETLLAKDAVIASQEKLIATLKTKKSSPWKRLGDILIGVAAGAVLR